MISATFSVNYWERVRPLPQDYVLVSLVKEFSAEKLFSVSQNYNEKGRSKQIKVAQKRLTPSDKKNPSQSFRMSDSRRLEVTRENKQNEDQSDRVMISFSESKTKTDEDNRGVSDTNHDLSLFQNIQAESQYSGMSGEIFSHQGIKSSLLNTHPRDSGNSDLLRAIRSSIERAKSYPFLARQRGIEGTVLVSFMIDKKGLPQAIRIVKSSGYQILDEEVPRMIRRASPFPGLKGEIVIPITFKLTESISKN